MVIPSRKGGLWTATMKNTPRRMPHTTRGAHHLGPESAAKIRPLAHIAAADFIHLHHSGAEAVAQRYVKTFTHRA